MELSKRLQAAADLLSEGLRVADIGCDHGFLSIFLVESGKTDYCLAMDINEGPLKRAKKHIGEQQLSTYIETRLSDGASELRFLPADGKKVVLEVQAAVLSGMGGRLMIRILEESREKFFSMDEFILQPQSEIAGVRAWLRQNGYHIMAEDMVLEDGKFYPMMKVCPGEYAANTSLQVQTVYDAFGEFLLKERHPVLKQFLEREQRLYEGIFEKIKEQKTSKCLNRQEEIKNRLNIIQQGLRWFTNEV